MTRLADENFMAKALDLSHSHLGQTANNPSVGCIIVKDGEIVGRGVTAVGGRPHAETIALEEAGEAAHGATAYITLEPCSHHGKTPPCADALIEAGIARVVAAIEDPDKRVSGQGLQRLKQAGIAVDTGVLADKAERELAAYLTAKRKDRAHVTLKMAVSQDGMIGLPGEGQVFITGPESRDFVHQLRAESHAILVGLGTVRADDPELTCRLPGLFHRSPIRIVLDRALDISLDSKLVKSAHDVPLLVVAHSDADEDRAFALQDAGAEVLYAKNNEELLLALATRGIYSVLVEGGARVATALLEDQLVDRIYLLTGSKVVGEGGIAAPLTPEHMPAGFRLVREGDIGVDHLREFERED
ncbi:bifunctional diaminohydroxyphosphoribosylaminopyrimidine deaminase/5-amino-6-(5-phosphoribosylamino)uracil reductase RibD [Rhizobium sp. L1K21]|uniref:bifunctional diaminohydroxyphosphoribosylaminopyrimidine deaminase/5-amino-6-(5-phosphoribosylamino)uracil reductase RibD n=1 Tax=Rhizobium sp. L1K21 TaxID=2954933 RepID=UPI00209273FB|nr:bifunctional diaminohydroxyphosphoribosylaminopyrimidine deaminase/5-amino-6-(5-phosphoribosylamino)uracil reductase RibD [Rhizobium sp. L1K21]MCO6185823.1 bifunctional diaminohydroxyphosphoribosylaminopyrimidine deaminase/5-amino-6-(5-phosphoribosylamino)uracil reductase RibD [Rhizobium sp. L1K21]